MKKIPYIATLFLLFLNISCTKENRFHIGDCEYWTYTFGGNLHYQYQKIVGVDSNNYTVKQCEPYSGIEYKSIEDCWGPPIQESIKGIDKDAFPIACSEIPLRFH